MRWQDLPPRVLAALRKGVAIPAHPLALDSDRKLDPRRQRALTRYYLAAGAGGVAVGVHTTQFAIREAGLYRAVLSLAAEETRRHHRRVTRDASDAKLLDHARAVAEVVPVFGFYLQPAVGGRDLGFDFWARFVEIPNV